ncbi:hypothetical protein PMAYCL1PPCAC_08476, partial [Pristionchus mayeri]
ILLLIAILKMSEKLVLLLTLVQVAVIAISTSLFIWILCEIWTYICSSQVIVAICIYIITNIPAIVEIISLLCSYRLILYRK